MAASISLTSVDRQVAALAYECPICLETKEDLRLICLHQHFLCFDCLNTYLQDNDLCPTCREPLVEPSGGFPPYRDAQRINTEIPTIQENFKSLQRKAQRLRHEKTKLEKLEQTRQQTQQVLDQQREDRWYQGQRQRDQMLHQQWQRDQNQQNQRWKQEQQQKIQQKIQREQREQKQKIEQEEREQRQLEQRRQQRQQQELEYRFRVQQQEQDQRQRAQEFNEELINNDQQCVMECHCHKACGNCLGDCGDICIRMLSTNGYCDNSSTFCSWLGHLCCFACACRVCLMMMVAHSCCRVFNSNDPDDPSEPEGVVQMRKDAWKAVVGRQVPIFPYPFRLIWSIFILLLLLASIGVNIYHIIQQSLLLSFIALGINGLLSLLWVTFTCLNIKIYKPESNDSIKREGNSLSHFEMEQVQQVLSEITCYPQLCLSLILYHKHSELPVHPYAVWIVALLLVFGLRLYTAVKLRQYVRLYFARLIFSLIGNSSISMYLIGTLFYICITSEIQLLYIVKVSLSVLILVSSSWNILMFYFSHLYEVSLQSCRIIVSVHSREPNYVREVIKSRTDLETFHKNMYALSSPWYRILFGIWLFPSLAVLIIVIVFDDGSLNELTHTYLLCGYFALLVIVNHKTLLLSVSVHFTLLVIVSLFVAVCLISAALPFAAAMFVPILLCCGCISCIKKY